MYALLNLLDFIGTFVVSVAKFSAILQIFAHISLGEVVQTSLPTFHTERFRPLPPPENIRVTLLSTRLTTLAADRTTLSVELTVDWTHPQFRWNLTGYEIRFRSETALRAFDELLDRNPRSIAPSSTQLTQRVTGDLNKDSPQFVVQVFYSNSIYHQNKRD